jgi:hypothetical protein
MKSDRAIALRLLPQASVSGAAYVAPPECAHFRSYSSSLVLALTGLT